MNDTDPFYLVRGQLCEARKTAQLAKQLVRDLAVPWPSAGRRRDLSLQAQLHTEFAVRS